jgi:hypothetical protein
MRVLGAGAQPVVFNHVPKTAGTSLGFILRSHFLESEIAPARDRQSLRTLQPENRYALFTGHFSYAEIAPFALAATHITMLRDPVSRVISQYRNWHDPAHRPDNWNDLKEVDATAARAITITEASSLLEFVRSDDPYIQEHISNTQTLYVHPDSEGKRNLFHGRDVYSQWVLEESLNSLFQRFSYFGLAEQFEKSMHLFACTFSTPEPLRETPILNPAIGEGINISPEVIECIQERNRMDLELYARAVLEFERRYLEMARYAVSRHLVFEAAESAPNASATVVPADAMIQGDGWHAPEVSGGRRFRWTGKRSEASVIVPLAGRHAKAEVVVCCLPITPQEAWLGMHVAADGFEATDKRQNIEEESRLLVQRVVLQPAASRSDSLVQTVRISSPLVKGDSRDPRDRGVALHQIQWRWID